MVSSLASRLSDCEAFSLPGNHGGELERLAEQYDVDPQQLVDFSVNVNPLGPPPSLLQFLSTQLPQLTRYPDSESRNLSQKLTEHLRLPAGHILVGNGSIELIYLLCRSHQPKTTLIVQPTFSEYERAAHVAGSGVLHYQLQSEDSFRLDVDDLIRYADDVSMLFLCNPNNPTGQAYSREEVLRIAGSLPETQLVVDEAFADFLAHPEKHTVIDAVADFPNLIVLRSLTKIFAIPGLRLGYLVSAPDSIAHLKRVKEPWTVNLLAQLAGEHLLDQGVYLARSHQLIERERSSLLDELVKIDGLSPYPTHTNFILVRIEKLGLTTLILEQWLIRQGLIIRNCANFVGLNKHFFRIAILTRQENDTLLAALREIVRNTP